MCNNVGRSGRHPDERSEDGIAVRPRLFAVVLAFGAATAHAQSRPDPVILATIKSIRAIDNHSHPPAVVAAGQKDDEFDALPCDPLQPTDPTITTRPENPQYVAAWKALFGYRYSDRDSAHVRDLIAAKEKLRAQKGDAYPVWVLDQLGIDIELANRVAPGRGLTAPRFRWVPFADALLFPLDNSRIAGETPDRKIFFARENNLLRRYATDSRAWPLPSTLDKYLSQVVTATLERQKSQGAVAIKFEAAYLRSLNFRAPNRAAAEKAYSRYASGGVPADDEYTVLQDAIFHHIASEGGRLGLPIHIHTGFGCGGYFALGGSDPLLLEPVLNDESLRKTTFVLLHGGAGPFTQSIAALLMKPNVYTDFSEQTWLLPTRELAKTLRYVLEWYPEKVLFGTDLSPGSPAIDWESIGWQTTSNAREGLALALTGMMDDGVITRARALEIARLVMRGNALRMYRWPGP